MGKIVLITGASKGIGKESAELLSNNGYNVYGTSRNAKIPPTKKNNYKIIQMDINDDESVKKAIEYIIKKEKRIDLLINNAGWGISGSIEDTEIKQAKELFETNFFGVHRTCKQVIPIMRKQGEGKIINISSIGGILGLPYQGFYSSTKFAVEGYTEALRLELEKFNIKVTMVEPGDVKTSFTENREKLSSTSKESVYKENADKTLKIVEKDEQGGISPKKVAEKILRIAESKNPKLRYKVGSFSQKLIGSLKGFFPDRTIQWILKKYYKV